MIPPAVTLDHLVIAARTLADGAAYVRQRLGVDPRIHIHEPITAWPAGIQARIETPTGIAILN
jgi:hypothetical protein